MKMDMCMCTAWVGGLPGHQQKSSCVTEEKKEHDAQNKYTETQKQPAKYKNNNKKHFMKRIYRFDSYCIQRPSFPQKYSIHKKGIMVTVDRSRMVKEQ